MIEQLDTALTAFGYIFQEISWIRQGNTIVLDGNFILSHNGTNYTLIIDEKPVQEIQACPVFSAAVAMRMKATELLVKRTLAIQSASESITEAKLSPKDFRANNIKK